jgi:prephenate dehydrogenase
MSADKWKDLFVCFLNERALIVMKKFLLFSNLFLGIFLSLSSRAEEVALDAKADPNVDAVRLTQHFKKADPSPFYWDDPIGKFVDGAKIVGVNTVVYGGSAVGIATELAKHRMVLQSGVVIIDVASVKKRIAQAFAKFDSIQSKNSPVFVPTHPMGGGQEQGSSYARATLFVGRPWLITPSANTPENIISKISKFVAYCGSRPIIVGAEQHDRLVTYVSHFPGILSQLLLDFVSDQEKESLKFAGSGFEMMTRIGKSNNIRMRSQIAQSNAHNIRDVFDAFIHYIQQQDLELWKTSKSRYLNKQ